MAALPQLRPVSMRDSVVSAVRRALLEGRFQPGQTLSDVTLAAEMGVSRGPVREALLVLAKEGLVTHSQNKGFSALIFGETDKLEVSQVRLPMETLALELARDRVRPAIVARLTDLVSRLVHHFSAGEDFDYTQVDLEFHDTIWVESGNTRLVQGLRTLMVPYFAFGSAYRLVRPDLTPQLLREQHALYMDYLRRATSKSADECVRFHIGG